MASWVSGHMDSPFTHSRGHLKLLRSPGAVVLAVAFAAASSGCSQNSGSECEIQPVADGRYRVFGATQTTTMGPSFATDASLVMTVNRGSKTIEVDYLRGTQLVHERWIIERTFSRRR